MASKVITLRIPDALHERAVAAAEAANSNVADFLRQLIVEKMNTQLQVDPLVAMEARLLQEFPRLQEAIFRRLDKFEVIEEAAS